MLKITSILLFSILVFSCAASRKDDNRVNPDDYPCFNHISPQVREEPREPHLIIEFDLTDTLLNEKIKILPNNINPIMVMATNEDTLTFFDCLNQIEYPEYWKDLGIQGNSYYGLEIDENGALIAINPLRTLDKNDLLLLEVERVIKSIRFIGPRFYSRNLLFRVKLMLA
jgi:hypothetical protein